MPIYEYECKLCGHHLEAIQKFSDAPLVECPECHQVGLNKLISSTSFQLKGTGWYVTDIRDKNKPKPSEAATSTEKTDAKPKEDKPKPASDKSTES